MPCNLNVSCQYVTTQAHMLQTRHCQFLDVIQPVDVCIDLKGLGLIVYSEVLCFLSALKYPDLLLGRVP